MSDHSIAEILSRLETTGTTPVGNDAKYANKIPLLNDNGILDSSFFSGATGLTSVGLSTNMSFFSVGGSPLTSNGTITFNSATGLTANKFLATPNGSTGSLLLRGIALADLPLIPVSSLTATGTPDNTTYLRGDGTWSAPTGTGTVTSVAATVPNWLSISGSPITTSGTLAITANTANNLPAYNGSALTNLTAANLQWAGTEAINCNTASISIIETALLKDQANVSALSINNRNLIDATGTKLIGVIAQGATGDWRAATTSDMPAGVTIQGNTFNGANELVQLDGTGSANIPGTLTLNSGGTLTSGGVGNLSLDAATSGPDQFGSFSFPVSSSLGSFPFEIHAEAKDAYAFFGFAVGGGQFPIQWKRDAVTGDSVQLTSTSIGVTGNLLLVGELFTTASTSTNAGLNLPHGTAPTTPNNGDIWTTTSGLYVEINGATVGPLGTGGGGGSGTVTSVALTVPSWLTVSGSPITTSGTLTVTGTSEAANLILASPNGTTGALTPRSLVVADLPTTVTNQGNTFNGISELVQRDGTGAISLPITGSGDITIAFGNDPTIGIRGVHTSPVISLIDHTGDSFPHITFADEGHSHSWDIGMDDTLSNQIYFSYDSTKLLTLDNSGTLDGANANFTGTITSNNYIGGVSTFSTNTTLTSTSKIAQIFTGSTTTTLTLPAISGTTGLEFIVKSRGSAILTVSRAGSDNIFDVASVTSVTINTGQSLTFVNDGTYWVIV